MTQSFMHWYVRKAHNHEQEVKITIFVCDNTGGEDKPQGLTKCIAGSSMCIIDSSVLDSFF